MSTYVRRPTLGDSDWFVHDRFGMFIHWGLYALPARHEWIKKREEISDEKYQQYFDHFDPDLYDPRDWARRAKAAGMRYAVFTTKHHEGFCMFDSAYTDYKCTNTKAGRDLVREYVDAFRAEGLRVGFYYSLLDWHHPDFTIDCHHPLRNSPDALEMNKTRDMRRYAKYMRDQITELLTNYGKIDVLWFDFSYETPPTYPQFSGKGKEDWEAEELIALARRLQPHILIDNRTGLEQDIWTPEQYQPNEWVRHKETGELVTWETCQTFSGSWGYHRDESTWKSPRMLVEMLINTVSEGGNLLMNVGPTARGYLDARAVKALEVYAEWMKYNSRSIYGCTKAEPQLSTPRGCRLTQSEDGKRLYVHLMEYPFKHLWLPNMRDKIKYAQFLHDGSEVLIATDSHSDLRENEWDVRLLLPVIAPDVTVPVIEIFLK